LIVCMAILFAAGSDNAMTGMRLAVFVCGLWWFIFSLFTFVALKERPLEPLPEGQNYIKFSIMSFIGTIDKVKKLPQTARFLIAFFIFSDAMSTIPAVGILFAQREMGMATFEVTILALLVPLFAAWGIPFHSWLAKKLELSQKQMILLVNFEFCVLMLYGLIGFIPGSPIGLHYPIEIYIFGAIYGSIMGYSFSLSRVLFADLSPPGCESEFFSFFEITDKGSSWMGPAICGAFYELTGTARTAFTYLISAFIFAIFLLKNFDPLQGKQDAALYSEDLKLEKKNLTFSQGIDLSRSLSLSSGSKNYIKQRNESE